MSLEVSSLGELSLALVERTVKLALVVPLKAKIRNFEQVRRVDLPAWTGLLKQSYFRRRCPGPGMSVRPSVSNPVTDVKPVLPPMAVRQLSRSKVLCTIKMRSFVRLPFCVETLDCRVIGKP